MNQDIKANFIKKSELYLKTTECDAKTSNAQDAAAALAFLEKKMSNRFFHCSKSVLLEKLG